MQKRKNNLKDSLKRMEKAGQSLSGVEVSKNPSIARLELRALGIAARCKKEGITSA